MAVVVGGVGGASGADVSNAWIFGLRLLITNTAPMITTATMPPISKSPNTFGASVVGTASSDAYAV